MDNPFSSPSLTLTRAKHHIDDLAGQIYVFTDNNPGAEFFEIDPNTGKHHRIIKFAQFPEIWTCILFDAANNLRSTLDQIGYAVAIAAKTTSTKHIKFPFAANETHWANTAGCCKDLHFSTYGRSGEPASIGPTHPRILVTFVKYTSANISLDHRRYPECGDKLSRSATGA